MIYALLLGALFTLSLYIADCEHRQAGISRFAYFVVAVLAGLAWPILLGVAIRNVVLQRRAKRPTLRV